MQGLRAHLLWPLAALLGLGCSAVTDSPSSPVTGAAPTSWAEIVVLLDPALPELQPVFAAEAAGDTLLAASHLLDFVRAAELPPIPHQTSSQPVVSADELLNGILELPPHVPWTLPADPTWSEDPFDDSNWRFQYHSFRWATPLVDAYRATNDDAYLDRLVFLMRDYAATNLAGEIADAMVWYDMAAAIRSENWLYIWGELLAADRVDIDFMLSFLGWSHHQAEALATQVPYAAGNNHGCFHNRALMASGLALPAFHAAPGWYLRGFERFQNQITTLVSETGVYLEPSPFYHFYMMGTFRSVRSLLLGADLDLDAGIRDRMEKMALFGARIVGPTGLLPMLSDCPSDYGLAGYYGFDPELDYSISAGAQGERPQDVWASYPSSGYTLFRSGWGQSRPFALETQAVFDVGPLGGWHGHHDALSFVFTSHGAELVVDSGYYSFDGIWRQYFLSPEAHNMLVPASGWSGPFPEPRRLIWATGSDWAFQSGSLPWPGGGTWLRCVAHLAPDDLLIIDRVFDGDPQAIHQLFHLPPAAEFEAGTEAVEVRHGPARLELWQAWPAALSTVSGELEPIQGWYSPVFGDREPNTVLRFELEADTEPRLATLLHAHDGEDPLLAFRCVERGDSHYVFEIERQGGVESVTVRTDTGEVQRSR